MGASRLSCCCRPRRWCGQLRQCVDVRAAICVRRGLKRGKQFVGHGHGVQSASTCHEPRLRRDCGPSPLGRARTPHISTSRPSSRTLPVQQRRASWTRSCNGSCKMAYRARRRSPHSRPAATSLIASATAPSTTCRRSRHDSSVAPGITPPCSGGMSSGWTLSLPLGTASPRRRRCSNPDPNPNSNESRSMPSVRGDSFCSCRRRYGPPATWFIGKDSRFQIPADRDSLTGAGRRVVRHRGAPTIATPGDASTATKLAVRGCSRP